jgi:polyhydroxybutyrate depolymerase
MRRKSAHLTAALFVLVAACSPSGGTSEAGASASPLASAATPTPTTATNPSPSATAGSREIVVGGDRPVTVQLPEDKTAPAPLLIVLHGFGSSGREHESYFHFSRLAAARGVVYAHPDGTPDSEGNRFWNATDACCDFEDIGVDDVAYLASVIDEISRATSIDPTRIYFVGHSNGGFMSYRMACEGAAVVAAIVSLAGATFVDRADCAPSEPVAVLEIHGTADDVITWSGGTLDIGPKGEKHRYPGVEETLTAWSTYDGCSATLTETPTRVDVDAGIIGPDGPAEATVKMAAGCDAGGHVELWTIPNGGHGPNLSGTFAASVLDFLLAHPKP